MPGPVKINFPRLVPKQSCCFEFVWGGKKADVPTAQLVMKALKDFDADADPVALFRMEEGKKKVVVRDCTGRLARIKDLIMTSDASGDHPNRIFEAVRNKIKKFVTIGLGAKFRCRSET